MAPSNINPPLCMLPKFIYRVQRCTSEVMIETNRQLGGAHTDGGGRRPLHAPSVLPASKHGGSLIAIRYHTSGPPRASRQWPGVLHDEPRQPPPTRRLLLGTTDAEITNTPPPRMKKNSA